MKCLERDFTFTMSSMSINISLFPQLMTLTKIWAELVLLLHHRLRHRTQSTNGSPIVSWSGWSQHTAPWGNPLLSRGGITTAFATNRAFRSGWGWGGGDGHGRGVLLGSLLDVVSDDLLAFFQFVASHFVQLQVQQRLTSEATNVCELNYISKIITSSLFIHYLPQNCKFHVKVAEIIMAKWTTNVSENKKNTFSSNI